MGYAQEFARRNLVVGAYKVRLLSTYYEIDALPTQPERDRAARLYDLLNQIEDWSAGPLGGGCIGMIIGVILAGVVTQGAAFEHGNGVIVGMGLGFALGFLGTRFLYYSPRLQKLTKKLEEMYQEDPALLDSLRALSGFDPSAVRMAWKYLPTQMKLAM